jgi:hypothetical protein
MTQAELQKALTEHHVPDRVYDFHNRGVEDAWGMMREPDGRWVIFNVERGKRRGEAWFTSEHDACFYLLCQIKRHGHGYWPVE